MTIKTVLNLAIVLSIIVVVFLAFVKPSTAHAGEAEESDCFYYAKNHEHVVKMADEVRRYGEIIVFHFKPEGNQMVAFWANSGAEQIETYSNEIARGVKPIGVMMNYGGQETLAIITAHRTNDDGDALNCAPTYL